MGLDCGIELMKRTVGKVGCADEEASEPEQLLHTLVMRSGAVTTKITICCNARLRCLWAMESQARPNEEVLGP